MKFFKKFFIVHSILLLIISCSERGQIINERSKAEQIVSPKTVQSVINKADTEFTRVSDLGVIVYALEKYKMKYRMYPISSADGIAWDGLYSDYGLSKVEWIEGLVPEFLSELPRDPRMHTDGSQQYIYRSNGAHYKLISHSPDDCAAVREELAQLMDPVRDCWAYGYWTKRAGHW